MEKGKRVVISFDIGIKNLACCVLYIGEKQDTSADILLWYIISLAAPKEKIPAVQELTLRLFHELDALVEKLDANGFTEIDSVLVENQPSKLNGSMKTIQMMIYSYFQLRKHWEGKARTVHMISAAGKLKDHTYTVDVSQVEKTGYELNKWKAVRLAEMYIKDDTKLQEVFCSYNKKDDMSDAMLQAVAWLRKNKHDITSLDGSRMICV
jgi:hypothetical protein